VLAEFGNEISIGDLGASKEEKLNWVQVAHACNPTYLGGRDQEDRSSKLAGANSSSDPILKKPITKIGLVEWFKVVGSELSLSTTKKKKKKK
jgi:hypothetical protein